MRLLEAEQGSLEDREGAGYHDVVIQLADDPDFIENVTTVFKRGSDWYSSIGTATSKGTKIFALSGKVTSFVGPMLVATVTAITASQRAGMAVLVLFFAAGAFLLAGVSARRP